MNYKLFIPGPVAVSEKTLRAMTQPMIGHRSSDFVALYQSLQPDLQALFYTQDPVYLSTSSAWGMMEAAVRNVTKQKVLNCMNGAFSDKWNDVAQRCGKPAGAPVDVLTELMVPRLGGKIALMAAVLLRLAWLAAELAISGVLWLRSWKRRGTKKL